MNFKYNNIEYTVADNITTSPLYRQNAMTIYQMIKPNVLGMKEYTDDYDKNPFTGYFILCEVNEFLQWVEVDRHTGEQVLKVH